MEPSGIYSSAFRFIQNIIWVIHCSCLPKVKVVDLYIRIKGLQSVIFFPYISSMFFIDFLIGLFLGLCRLFRITWMLLLNLGQGHRL